MGEEHSHDDLKYKRWRDITGMVAGAMFYDRSPLKLSSASVVPNELRKWNENAYMPKVISIGPRHNGRKELLPMEEIKWRSVVYLMNRSVACMERPNSEEYIFKCMDAILEIDAKVRACYVGELELDRYDLAAIMFNDGCLLLELLISGSSILDSKLPLLARFNYYIPSPAVELEKMEVIMRDLTLLENQIPFFIIIELFRKFFSEHSDESDHLYLIPHIKNRAMNLFGFQRDMDLIDFNFAHFLELASWNIHKDWEELQTVENVETQLASNLVDISEQVIKYQCLNRCATRLKAVGVTIKPLNVNVNVNDNSPPTPVSTLKFGFKFDDSRGILEIPQVHITPEMEAKWLNLIAWEHHKKWRKPKSSLHTIRGKEYRRWCLATSSALLFNDLICCSSDVQLLKDKGIILVDDDLDMNNQDLMALFHSLGNGVDRGIVDIKLNSNCDALNKYSTTKCTTRIPILLWHNIFQIFTWLHTFRKFLSHGYNFAATAVTLLTVLQTVYSILSYHFPKSSS